MSPSKFVLGFVLLVVLIPLLYVYFTFSVVFDITKNQNKAHTAMYFVAAVLLVVGVLRWWDVVIRPSGRLITRITPEFGNFMTWTLLIFVLAMPIAVFGGFSAVTLFRMQHAEDAFKERSKKVSISIDASTGNAEDVRDIADRELREVIDALNLKTTEPREKVLTRHVDRWKALTPQEREAARKNRERYAHAMDMLSPATDPVFFDFIPTFLFLAFLGGWVFVPPGNSGREDRGQRLGTGQSPENRNE